MRTTGRSGRPRHWRPCSARDPRDPTWSRHSTAPETGNFALSVVSNPTPCVPRLPRRSAQDADGRTRRFLTFEGQTEALGVEGGFLYFATGNEHGRALSRVPLPVCVP